MGFLCNLCSFVITNFNPFRDSTIINSESANNNIEVPDLFTKAFFSTSQLQGENEAAQERTQIMQRIIDLWDRTN